MSLVPVLTPLGTARTSWSKLSNFSAHPQHLTEQSLPSNLPPAGAPPI